MLTAQNISLIFGLICFTQFIFISSGFLTARFISKGRLDTLEELILSFITGALTLSILTIVTLMFDFSNASQGCLIVLCLVLNLSQCSTAIISSIRENLATISVWSLYSAFAMFSVLDPNLELQSFTLAEIQYHFGLPIDNLIPFQTVRYLTERINPNLLDPVPNWQFGNRGPFLGFSIASMFLLLGVTETSTWLNSSFPSSVIFESASIVFNSLCLIVAYSFTTRFFGKKAGLVSLLLLIINPFCFINIVFSWPKLFSASLGLFALQLLLLARPFFTLSLVLLGLGFLAHESISFSVFPFLTFIFFRFGLIRFLSSMGVFLLTLAPWTLYKILWNQNTSNLFVHNVLCIKEKVEGSFYNLFKEKIDAEGLATFIRIRLDNFNYPFDFTYVDWTEKFSSLGAFMSITQTLTDITFYQFIYALGPIIFLTFLVLSVYKVRYKRHEMDLTVVFLSLFISALAVAVFQGCVLSTWNHHWAYLPLLIVTIYTSKELLQINRFVAYSLLIVQSYLSLAILVNYIWFPPRSVVRYAANSQRETMIFLIAGIIGSIILAQFIWGLRDPNKLR